MSEQDAREAIRKALQKLRPTAADVQKARAQETVRAERERGKGMFHGESYDPTQVEDRRPAGARAKVVSGPAPKTKDKTKASSRTVSR